MGSKTQWGSRPRDCRNVRKVCIFDLDNSLTIGADAVCNREDRSVQPAWPFKDGNRLSGTTENIKAALHSCQENGYDIAFATSESYEEAMNTKQKEFVRHLYPDADEIFFQGPFFQHAGKGIGSRTQEYGLKQHMYMNILGVNGKNIDYDDWGCSIVFDDEISNLYDAQRMGLRVVQASPECGGKHCTVGCGIPASAISAVEMGIKFSRLFPFE